MPFASRGGSIDIVLVFCAGCKPGSPHGKLSQFTVVTPSLYLFRLQQSYWSRHKFAGEDVKVDKVL